MPLRYGKADMSKKMITESGLGKRKAKTLKKKKAIRERQREQARKERRAAAERETKNNNPPRASLLGIPGEIRNTIFRMSLVEDHTIRLDSKKNRLEPGLLRCCRSIRREAQSIFFEENRFLVTIHNCRVAGMASHWIWRNGAVPDDRTSVIMVGKPSWSSLKTWVKLWLKYEGKGIPWYGEGRRRLHRICAKAFAVADAAEPAGEKRLDAVLEAFRETVEMLERKRVFDD